MEYRISRSKLDILRECPRCFWLVAKKNVARPGMPIAGILMKIDSILKRYFNLYREKGELPPILQGKINGKLANNMPRTLSYKYGSILLTAQPDDYLELDDGSVISLDNKSASGAKETIHPAYQFQQDVHTYLIHKNQYKTINKAFLAFFYPCDCELHNGVPFLCDIKEIKTDTNIVEELLKKAEKILELEEPPEANENCTYCKWWVSK